MVWGYFKKLVIADNVGVIGNKVFALADPSFPVLWAGVFAFAIQIYADFSAYSDIARGTARWLGVDLMQNFDHPYFAVSGADGTFTITNVPAGSYKLDLWHEKYGDMSAEVKVEEGKEATANFEVKVK